VLIETKWLEMAKINEYYGWNDPHCVELLIRARDIPLRSIEFAKAIRKLEKKLESATLSEAERLRTDAQLSALKDRQKENNKNKKEIMEQLEPFAKELSWIMLHNEDSDRDFDSKLIFRTTQGLALWDIDFAKAMAELDFELVITTDTFSRSIEESMKDGWVVKFKHTTKVILTEGDETGSRFYLWFPSGKFYIFHSGSSIHLSNAADKAVGGVGEL